MARLGNPKRKSDTKEYTSDDGFVENDSGDASDRPSKRSKTASKSAYFATPAATQVDAEGNQYWEISKMRRITISEFKGKRMVSIREYYEKDGKDLPGKKGITMTLEQYTAFIEVMPQIEMALVEKGERVPRPTYNSVNSACMKKEAEDNVEEEADDARKANIEATSDEDEE